MMIKKTKQSSISLLVAAYLTGCGGSDSSNTDITSDNSDTVASEDSADAVTTRALESVGEALFFDTNLSDPPGQSCGSCHDPSVAFADPDSQLPTSEGAVPAVFGNRNTPTVMYAVFTPGRMSDQRGNRFEGGLFMDGRADSLEEQAVVPFLNPLEMNNANAEQLIQTIRDADYADDFKTVFGAEALDNAETALLQVGEAIAAFERTDVFAPFSSKFDAVQNGTETFTAAERRGQGIFNGRGQCSRCHSTTPNALGQVLFTNFEYENIGVPANPANLFHQNSGELNPDGADFVDEGLGGAVNQVDERGKFRVPTLRNVAVTAPYMHNGVFGTLEEVVEFYNSRDVDPTQAPAEVAVNISNIRIGNLGLNDAAIRDLVAFMETLTDR